MNVLSIAIAFLFVDMVCAGAFENIETDAAYERSIREQIRIEYAQSLKFLKAQAERLKMDVREKDVISLREHLYNKAVLWGNCLDKRVTERKVESLSKIDLQAAVKTCVELHIRFMDWYKQAPKPEVMVEFCLKETHKRTLEKPYDFLGIPERRYQYGNLASSPLAYNYIAMRDCYEKQGDFLKALPSMSGYPRSP